MRSVVDNDDGAAEEIDVARHRRAVTETAAVLRQASVAWAAHSCPGTAECCQLTHTQRQPWLWPTEWSLLQEHLRRAGRTLPPPRSDGGCPFLDAAGLRCTVYEARPFGCRTFFCHRVRGPANVPAQTTHALLDRLTALNIELDPNAAPKALLDWSKPPPEPSR